MSRLEQPYLHWLDRFHDKRIPQKPKSVSMLREHIENGDEEGREYQPLDVNQVETADDQSIGP